MSTNVTLVNLSVMVAPQLIQIVPYVIVLQWLHPLTRANPTENVNQIPVRISSGLMQQIKCVVLAIARFVVIASILPLIAPHVIRPLIPGMPRFPNASKYALLEHICRIIQMDQTVLVVMKIVQLAVITVLVLPVQSGLRSIPQLRLATKNVPLINSTPHRLCAVIVI
jgi:hypothetical protein